MAKTEFVFHIKAYSPETIPMERLGEYMADLGALLGEGQRVHFVALVHGSTGIAHAIDDEAVNIVSERLADVRRGVGHVSHLRAYESLNRRLREDNADAEYKEMGSSAVILQFPGKRQIQPESIGPIDRQCTIDGVVISLGGKDATVPVKLQDESSVFDCNTTRELARQIAPYIFGQTLRVYGVGKWFRNEETGWHMKGFKIESFIVLKDADILHEVYDIRSIPATWGDEAV